MSLNRFRSTSDKLVPAIVAVLAATVGSAAHAQSGTCDSQWSQTVGGPPPIYCHASTYDSIRHRVVVFGGSTGCATNETWEFDGTAWSHPSPANRPPRRTDCTMAFDSVRGVCVLFGGYPQCFGSVLNDTWEWDGVNWTEKNLSSAVRPSSAGSMAYNPVTGKTMLARGGPSPELWEWDGAAWMQRSFPTSWPQAPEDYPQLVFDAGRNAMLVLAAHVVNQVSQPIDLWRLDGNSLTLLHSQVFSWPPASQTSAYSSALNQVVLFRGSGSAPNETWRFVGSEWIPVSAPPPSARGCASFAYDDFRDRFVLFGGHGPSGLQSDTTWELQVGSNSARIAQQPQGGSVTAGSSFSMSVTVTGDAPVSYQWRRDGVNLSDDEHRSGTQAASLVLSQSRVSDSGGYDVVVSNVCGATTSATAALAVTCAADFNNSGAVSVQDIFDFLATYFGGVYPLADFNHSGTLSVQDIFDFLAAYFAGCP